ncbi:hypothetical protein ACFRCI_09475 [Streptomyces sp. NPDC056638]|uniref:hypothetical protein n=1 Tax=Streptomyces sp. NPDC056638 TaxID=3345887 RepID=UPI00367AA89D
MRDTIPLHHTIPGGTMRTRTTTAALIAAGLLATLTACGSSDNKADPAACKTAMAKAFDDAMAAGDKAEQSKRPAACAGVDDKTVQRIAGELISEQASQATENATESTAPDDATAQLSDECRAWIKGELLDSSDDIDATAGQGVCSDLSDEEMDQAIEDVTNELTDATP